MELDIYNVENKNELETAIQYQASAWTVPKYIHLITDKFITDPFLNIYLKWWKKAGVVAYQDIKSAFEYYLKYFNKGRPIIHNGHNQGAFIVNY